MDFILHLLGLCPDSFSHPSLLMLIPGFGIGWFAHIKGWFHRKKKCDCGCHKEDTK